MLFSFCGIPCTQIGYETITQILDNSKYVINGNRIAIVRKDKCDCEMETRYLKIMKIKGCHFVFVRFCIHKNVSSLL